MNREIKFRGKSEYGVFVYGDLIRYENGDAAIFEKKLTKYGCEATEIYKRTKVDIGTVGQFTGLYDKNGEDIYEGDIVKTPLLDPIFGDILSDAFDNAPIAFHNGAFTVDYYQGGHKIYLQDLYDKIEIIGNIYDNKELLEK